MTRINLTPVDSLADQHLMAEYRELPRVFTYVKKLQDSGKTPKDIDIPSKFTFGNGHIKFFVNKLAFLEQRYYLLVDELLSRGYNIEAKSLDNKKEGIESIWFGIYYPTIDEKRISQERINNRLAMKPAWYRWSNNNNDSHRSQVDNQ